MQLDERELAKSVGKAIASRRMEAGLTQEEVAEKLGVGNEAVSRMERGTVMPTVGRLVALSQIFSCGVNDLLSQSSPRMTDQGQRIADILEHHQVEDRAFLIAMLEQLSTHLIKRG
ncbi:helix-turn-helix domain-containing protein [Kerstersia gyiorum]|uniref:DNA-binding protein n=1 Tax=Kerstersia gyiorum TaxID=206506 RepID=A0A171KUC5_9BURK|nr:helix-turn-helix transcriptional regulator [Kerstersia gyiorum]KKO72492.1 DNA-binding protein [Kerstersia gyiorum]